MRSLEEISKELKEYLGEHQYDLYSLEYVKEDENHILRVCLDNHLDLNKISEVSSLVGDFLDEKDYIEEAYLLDVSTVGLERPLRNLEEIKKAKGQYVFMKLKEEVNGLKKVEGDIKDVDDEKLTLSYKDKNIKKEMTVLMPNIKFIRLAVKF